MPCHAMPCHAMPWPAKECHAMECHGRFGSRSINISRVVNIDIYIDTNVDDKTAIVHINERMNA
eukprot:3304013-Lingulodinium_polyedra.AAC.1